MTIEQQYRLNALRQLIAADGEDVFIAGRNFRGFVEEITHDEIILAGGYAEAGGFRATIPMADLPQKPEQGTAIMVREKSLEVIRITERNYVSYEITAGSPLAEQ
jgi:hypothetical protein